ncbi:MAG TPA: hypothetical protein VN256_23210 [Pyrinomonadaceae bacterium]|nr:hypothetical protein [Pyrinomonadaceae bacterium]
MIRRFSPLVLLLCLVSSAFAQDRREARDRRALDRAANNGRPLQTELSVRGNVTAQAVLIPRVDARRIFGKEIADNYAVIEVNVGNKSSDAALIIHGIFIDYSRWALSGTPHLPPNTVDGLLRGNAEQFQTATVPSQVASEEYRVVRGQLLDAQMWSRRNWVMRLLTFAGNLAGAYAFSINEEGIVRGLNAFSGVFVPGFRELWPDGTIDQLNRISDFGFQTNKVIPREGAEVIVCFFPIDRFLTPGFKKLFLKSPALFFSPLQMLADRKLRKEAEGLLQSINSGFNVDDLNKLLPCYLHIANKIRFRSTADEATNRDDFLAQMNESADKTCFSEFGLERTGGRVSLSDETKFKQFLALDFISQMSLNTVTVTIDGVMTVDATNVASKIDAVAFDNVADCGGDRSLCFWANTAANEGVRTGTISGSYMTGGSVSIAEANELGITGLTTTTEGATDQKLRFSFKLTKPIPPDTMLHFSVNKTQSDGPGTSLRTIGSLTWDYRVGYSPAPPKITEVVRDGNKLTVTGTGFYDIDPTYPLGAELISPAGVRVKVPRDSIKVNGNQLEFDIPTEAQTEGCWKVVVRIGALPSKPEEADCE